MQNRGEKRYEIKLPLEMEQFFMFESVLKSLCLYPKNIYPDRVIHSIYFDTPNFISYLDNISGSSNRVKIRLRYYDSDIQNLRLEYKFKQNKSSNKEVFEIKNRVANDLTNREQILKLLKINKIPKKLLNLYPVLKVEYKRSYFEIEKDIRMTIDREIKYQKLYPIKSKMNISSPVFCVVEFKYPLDKTAKIKKILHNLPFRIFRHSKYVIGIDSACVA